MPVSTKVSQKLGLTGFSTYGADPGWASSPYFYEERSRSWVNGTYRTKVQRAKRLLERGFLPTQAYTDNLQQVVNSKVVDIVGRLTSANNAVYQWRFIPNPNRPSTSLTDPRIVALRTRALEKLQSKISGEGANVPVTILEAGKTADMIGTRAKQLAQAARLVRKGQFGRAASVLKISTPKNVRRPRRGESARDLFASNWMEYRYGWRLVLVDIVTYMKTIHKLLSTKPIVLRVKTSQADTGYHWWNWLGQVAGTASYPFIFLYDRYRRDDLIYQVTAGYVYQLESVALSTGQELGLLNLPLVGWEMIPASFVVDWALNVGSVLEGLTAFQGKQFLDGYVTMAVEGSRFEQWTNLRKGTSVFSFSNPGSVSLGPVIERRFERQVLTGFVPSSLRLEYGLTFQRGIDGLSLIHQVFLSAAPSRKY